MKRRIKKDDLVIVISGSNKHASQQDGAAGNKVLAVNYAKNQVLIEGINVRRVTVRATPTNQQRSAVDRECPIHLSNVMLKDEWDARKKA